MLLLESSEIWVPVKQIIQINLTGLRIQLAGDKPAGYLQALPWIWTQGYQEQIQLAVRAGLELGASELQVQRSSRSATLPPLGGVTRCYPRVSLG